jgi:hypothetical protein
MALTGLNEVMRNLNREIQNIEGDIDDGLLAAAIFVEGESNEIVPHDTGNLLNSSFHRVNRQTHTATVGYTSRYAPYVHEMPRTFNYTKPGTGPKFLQRSIAENQTRILSIIANRARI